MVIAQRPIDIIARELPDFEHPTLVAEDIITALEDAGWRFSWCGEVAAAVGHYTPMRRTTPAMARITV